MEENNIQKITPKKKSPGYCGVIVVAVLLSLVISMIVGFASSSLGDYVAMNYFNLGGETVGDVFNSAETIKVEEESGVIDAVDKVGPAVVSIVVTKELEQYYQGDYYYGDEFLDDYFGPGYEFDFGTPEGDIDDDTTQEIGGGSGFVISHDGLILTNKHVVQDETADYTVVTNEGEQYEAEILAKDTLLDIAVIKINAANLPVVEFGDSNTLKVGQTVIAIGNSLGEYQNSVTKGIVSGIGRAITTTDYASAVTERLENVIQTDAAINFGNSGGPLINISGQVIGINSAIDLAGQLIGFAIPINDVKDAVESVKTSGKIVRPYLGVRYRPITSDFAAQNDLPVDYGALVSRGEDQNAVAVIPGSPADKAGIVENDIILEVDGSRVTEEDPLTELVQKHEVGEQISLKILHRGDEKEVRLTLEERE